VQVYRNLLKRKNVRRLKAAAFLLFLFCEVGGHASLDAHEHGAFIEPAQTVHASFVQPDEHCEFSITCEDDSRHDPDSPNLQDQSSHHDALVATHCINFAINRKEAELITSVSELLTFRSVGPPFHPPKHLS
jgi:hypothetical protein